MGKRFLTARDIDEHADRGVMEIQIDDNVVITDIGRERARERQVRIVRVPPGTVLPDHPPCENTPPDQLRQKVRAAVIAKLGSAPENLDVIINKILEKQG